MNYNPATVQESPWGAENIDCRQKGLKELKFCEIAGFLKDKRGRLLEIGCGHGKMIRSLYQLNKEIGYTGCDINWEAIEFCKKSCPGAEFFVEKAENAKYNRTYDYVLLADILEHVSDPKKVLENTHRALKDNGYLILIVVSEGDPGVYSFLRFVKKDWSLKTRGHRNYFVKGKIFKKIERYFKIEEVKYMYHFFGSIFDAIFFFATLNNNIHNMFWRSGAEPKGKVSAFRKIVAFFEKAAYYESKLLKNVPLFSSVQFIIARKKDTLNNLDKNT
jgi:SAM-dependent methyltransferase